MGDDGMGGDFGGIGMGDFGGTDGTGLGLGGIGDGLGGDYGGVGFGGSVGDDGFGGGGFGSLGADPGGLFGGPDTSAFGNPFGQDLSFMDGLQGLFGSYATEGLGMGNAGFSTMGAPGQDIGSDFGGMLAQTLATPWGKGLMGLIGMANPALGAALNIGQLGLAASQGKGGQAMGGALGGQIGSALGSMAGPIGATVGGQLGSMAGANALNGVGAPAGSVGGMQGQGGLGDTLTGLAGIYAAQRGQDSAKRQQQNLERLFSPDSPYAQQMRQRLERRDAAAGRRSQYGSREVELAAKLAELNARTAPQIQQLSQQRDQERNRRITAGLMLAKNSGLFNEIGAGIGSLFGGSGAMF